MVMIAQLLLLLTVTSIASSSPVSKGREDDCGPTITTSLGKINGKYLEGFNQDIYLGIPYAVPPTADKGLQFSNPQPYASPFPLQGYSATEYSRSCPQYGPFAIGVGAPENQSEDCLTLNVIVPKDARGPLPVLVCIYGGGYTAGTSSSPVYNLSYIVEESVKGDTPIIAVSMNYRTAIFGFFASAEIVNSGNANVGLKDQRLALRWVKDNIAAFGGDCEKITIWGESAGAYSVGLQVTAYGGAESGLFRGAIYESGTALATYMMYDAIANSTNCSTASNTLDCLRGVPFDKLYSLAGSYSFTPVIDGDFIPDRPSSLLAQGRFDTRVASLIGSNTNEGTAAFFGWKGLNSNDDLENFLQNNTANGLNISSATARDLVNAYTAQETKGSLSELEGYNVTVFGKAYNQSATIAGDLFINAPRRYQCQIGALNNAPTFSYRFDQPAYQIPAFITGGPGPNPTHYAEISFVFGNPANLSDPYEMYLGPGSTGNMELSRIMMRSWAAFASKLDPNHKLLGVNWPDYRSGPKNLVFRNENVRIEDDNYRKAGMAIFNDNPEEFLH